MHWTIVGLGNPGKEYEWTRHNAGFIMIDNLKFIDDFSPWKKKLFGQAYLSTGAINEVSATLIKPISFMNNSGKALLKQLKSKEEIQNLIVIHDDVHLPLGSLRISMGRGDGGHNGITSIIQTLKTKDFIRIRVGIAPRAPSANEKTKINLETYVLGKFSNTERETLASLYEKISNIVLEIISHGVERTANIYN